MATLTVHLFFRKKSNFFSIEGLFESVVSAFDADVRASVLRVPSSGASLRTIVKNCLWACARQGTVNHITGDIHYIALSLNQKQTILTIHDLRLIEGRSSIRKLILKILWFSLPVRRVRFVTVISETTRLELLKYVHVDPEKIKVIPNCISSTFKHRPARFRKECPRIFHIGTTDNKNLERVINALQGITCELMILGTLSSNQSALLELNGISFKSYSKLSEQEVFQLYVDCDLVCFVSLYEGFGLPILEGNAVGRPVITSEVSSMPEVAGNAALLVDPTDTCAIHDGILRLIREPELREELIESGLKNIQRFQPSAIAAQYVKLYQQVADEVRT
jgi:glycosyltransferase involved in cell wall biosynthesis